jgi:hypothetical protein
MSRNDRGCEKTGHRCSVIEPPSRKDVIWPRRWLGEARCFKHDWPNTSE